MNARTRIDPLSRDIIRKALHIVRPQFRLDFAGGIHGVPHWSRVWFHGRRLAASMDINPAVLAWFAFLHDSQRHNDGGDPLHGHRAAAAASVPDRLFRRIGQSVSGGSLCRAARTPPE
jgi:hypothetical protein